MRLFHLGQLPQFLIFRDQLIDQLPELIMRPSEIALRLKLRSQRALKLAQSSSPLSRKDFVYCSVIRDSRIGQQNPARRSLAVSALVCLSCALSLAAGPHAAHRELPSSALRPHNS